MDDKIREAYDQMNPTPEQEKRMLAALQEAQLNAQSESSTAQKSSATQESNTTRESGTAQVSSAAHVSSAAREDGSPSFEAKPAPARNRKKLSAWKIAAPIAACLVVGAIAIGAGVIGQSGNTESIVVTTSLSASAPPAANAPSQIADGAKRESAENANGAAPTMVKEMAMDSAYEGEALGSTELYAIDTPPENDFNTEEYAAVDENGFVSTKAQPLSTVSADVDTASYANLRRMLNSGYALDNIPSGAVRIEEMLNYFTYDYEKPTGDDLFKVQAQAAQCPWNPDTQLLTIGFATQSETGAANKGANLVFLIDVSGSMDSPDKLELLQDSFTTLLQNLNGNDRVSIVTYSGAEEVVLEGVPGDDAAQIMRAIYKLRANGSTNGEAGLKMAYEVAERNFIEGGVNRIVMASDGDLNVGMTSESDLYDFVDGKRKSGVYLSVLGFGTGNYKDTKMEVLADHGNGSYHYIDSIEEANRVLSERLLANLVPFADNVKVQVEFNPSQIKGYRLIGYENRELAAEDFHNDAVDAGDVGPNAQFTVAYEVVPADSAYEVNTPELKYGANAKGTDYDNNSSDWLTCSLRYRSFSDDAMHEQQLVVDRRNETRNPNDDWKFASTVIEFGMLAGHSDYRGDITCDSILEQLDAQHLSPERQSFRDLVETAKRNSQNTRSDSRSSKPSSVDES